ncbi:protein kinase domain protein [Ilyonectria robusta]
MRPHWNNVTTVLLALAMKIGPLDEDGLDLLYTIGERNSLNVRGRKIETKFRQSIESAGDEIDDRSQTDMAATLSRIFDNYLKDFSRRQTLLILTDRLGRDPVGPMTLRLEDFVDAKPWDFPDVNKLILGSITQGADDATASSAPISMSRTPTGPPSASRRKRVSGLSRTFSPH